MPGRRRTAAGLGLLAAWGLAATAGAEEALPTTAERPGHRESAREHEGPPPPPLETPPLPEGRSLDEVLDRANRPPPPHYPDPVPDDALRAFVLFDQLEMRVREEGRDALGWEAQGWVGGDFDRFWWKTEGEAVFDGPDEGETETDLLYSRLVTPFWNVQAGVRYANEWEDGRYDDLWSGVVALQGLAPGMLELDASVYLSEDGDVTAELEGEYDLALTQTVVLQPRAELGFAAQDVRERGLEAGMTGADLDLRLRWEPWPDLAPYAGVRYRILVGDTADLAEARGGERDAWFLLVGLRLAF